MTDPDRRRFRTAFLAVVLAVSSSTLPAQAEKPVEPPVVDAGAGDAAESRPESRPGSLERLVERANHQNPYLSAQAAKALEAHGLAALPVVEAFVARRSIHALSAPVTSWLGVLNDPRATAILVRAVADREFPWRPFAVRALALKPGPDERALFRRLLDDPLTPVRESAALSLKIGFVPEAGDAFAETLRLRGLLTDASFDVRAAAAESLRARNDHSGVPVMLGALELTRRFFDLDFGELARRRAFDLVSPVLGAGISFEPGAPPDQRAFWAEIARARWARSELSAAASRPSGAEWAPDVVGVVFGLEVRSCRRGDAFVRLTEDGRIIVGQYDLRAAKLDDERLAEIRGALQSGRATPSASLYGRGGCDYERYYFPDEDGLIKVTVGPEGRPAGLRRLSGLLLGAIRDHFGPEAASLHLERVAPFATLEDQDLDPEDG